MQKIWRDKWFLSLPPLHKLVLEYVRAHCDPCGVWEFDRHEIESKIGFGEIDPAFVHAQIRGIEFATRELAEEDAEAKGLKPEKARPKELPRWSSIIASINKAPKEYDGLVLPQIEIIGENRWWLVRMIEQEFGWAPRGRRPAIKLNEPRNMRHRAAIRALRRNALFDRFKQYYPDAEIIESESAQKQEAAVEGAPTNTETGIPTLADVLGAPEGGRLPPTERRLFWSQQNEKDWPFKDWRNLLAAREVFWAIRFDYTQQTGNPWPETMRECEIALESIEEKLAAENANRVQTAGGDLRLPADAMARVKVLLAAKNLIETPG